MTLTVDTSSNTCPGRNVIAATVPFANDKVSTRYWPPVVVNNETRVAMSSTTWCPSPDERSRSLPDILNTSKDLDTLRDVAETWHDVTDTLDDPDNTLRDAADTTIDDATVRDSLRNMTNTPQGVEIVPMRRNNTEPEAELSSTTQKSGSTSSNYMSVGSFSVDSVGYQSSSRKASYDTAPDGLLAVVDNSSSIVQEFYAQYDARCGMHFKQDAVSRIEETSESTSILDTASRCSSTVGKGTKSTGGQDPSRNHDSIDQSQVKNGPSGTGSPKLNGTETRGSNRMRDGAYISLVSELATSLSYSNQSSETETWETESDNTSDSSLSTTMELSSPAKHPSSAQGSLEEISIATGLSALEISSSTETSDSFHESQFNSYLSPTSDSTTTDSEDHNQDKHGKNKQDKLR